MKRKEERGFSLIELIVVLVILGLLATLVGPRVVRWATQGKQNVTRVQIADYEGALEMFYLDVGRFPTSSEGLDALIEGSGIQNWDGPYLKKNKVPNDPWGNSYQYRAPGEHGDFDLWSKGADGREGGEGDNVDINNW